MITDSSAGFLARPDGRLILGAPAAGLYGWFAGEFLKIALDDAAEEYRFGPAISRETLARAGYFEAFPHGATPIAEKEDDNNGYCLAPAVCYHVFEHLAGRQFSRPVIITAESVCFRESDRRARDAGRLWEFTMREIVFVGTAPWVEARRREWMSRVSAFASALELAGSLEPATDLFFGATGRGRRLLQQIKGLKYELRLAVARGTLPVASFNLHETFFSRRFAMTTEDEGYAHSACVAFGLERWVLAFLEQHGPTAAGALIGRGSIR